MGHCYEKHNFLETVRKSMKNRNNLILQKNETSLVAQMVKHLSAYNAGDLGLIPGLGRSPGEENDIPL